MVISSIAISNSFALTNNAIKPTSDGQINKIDIKRSATKSNNSSAAVKQITWNTETGSNSNSYTWSDSAWEFGPTPSYSLTYENGSLIKKFDVVKKGPTNKFIVDINVPKDALAGVNLSQAGFYLDYSLTDPNDPNNYYSLSSQVGYSVVDSNWFNYTYEYNSSSPFGSSPTPPSVFIFDTNQRSFTFNTTTNTYQIHIVGYLDSSVPNGRWFFGLFVYDENFNSISFGYRAWSSPNPPYRDLFVEIVDTEFGGADGFKVKYQSLNGNVIKSVTREVPFLINMTISASAGLDSVMVSLNLPYSYLIRTNVTGWFDNTTTINSGWVWDPYLKTYVYNTSLNEEVTQQVYGTHEVLQEVYFDRSIEINGNFYGENLFLIAIPGNNSVYSKIGTWYYNDTTFEEKLYLRNLTSDLKDNLVKLNGGSITPLPDNKYQVVFNLTAVKEVPKGTQFYPDFRVKDNNGFYLWSNQPFNELQLNVESQIAETRLFTSKGEVKRDNLRIKPGESLRIHTELEGYTPDSTIQAASFVLRGNSYSWSDTEYQWSEVQIISRYDFKKDISEVVAYNLTQRQIWKNSTYSDWVLVEKVGFHYEYNASTGSYDWVNGTYKDWEYKTLTGYHWAFETWDHQAGKWVEDYLPLRHPKNKLNVSNILVINNRSVTFSNGILTLDMNITFTAKTPQLVYSFESRFESLEFREDFDAGFGLQTSELWLKEDVPTINLNNQMQYVDINKNPLALYYNGKYYLVNELPFVQTSKNSTSFIKKFIQYDFYSGTSQEIYVNSRYNFATGQNDYYYTLTNGTELPIEEIQGASIFTIQFNTSSLLDPVLSSLNGSTIETFQRFPLQTYNPSSYSYIYTYFLTNGSVFSFENYFSVNEFKSYFLVTNRTPTIINTDPQHWISLYSYNSGTGQYDKVQDLQIQGQVEYDWLLDKYYVVDANNGNRYYLSENSAWDEINDGYTYTNGLIYAPKWLIDVSGITYTLYENYEVYQNTDGFYDVYPSYFPTVKSYYNATFNSNSYTISSWLTRNLFKIKGISDIVLLPTDNSPAFDFYQLDHTTTEGGKIPTAKTVTINGTIYRLNRLPNGTWLLRDTSGNIFDTVNSTALRNDLILATINGTQYWNTTQAGFVIKYGKISGRDWKLIEVNGSLNAITDYDYWNGQYIRSPIWNWTDGSQYLLNASNPAQSFPVSSNLTVFMWKVMINATHWVYYSGYNYNLYETIYDPQTGIPLFYQITAFNGSVYNVTIEDFKILAEEHYYVDQNGLFTLPGFGIINISNYNLLSTYLDIAYVNGNWVELDFNDKWLPLYQLPINGQNISITYFNSPIKRVISHYGYPFRHIYTPDWNIITSSSVYNIIVGNPKNNLWGFEAWTVNPNNGALDVDGDLSTVEDQFFVRRIYSSTNTFNESYSHLSVWMYWDPNTTEMNNEFNLNGYMGFTTLNYSWQWSETYVWYYASNMSLISDATLSYLNSTMMNGDEPAAGYWGVAFMLNNRTWADIVAEAKANGWDWLADSSQSYTWLDFGFDQSYYTFTNQSGSPTWIHNSLSTSWTGLWLYNDTNSDGVADFNSDEITHTFIPGAIEDLVFTTPGVAFGNTNASGSITVNATDPLYNTSIDFGVQFLNVSGKTYPVIKDVFGNIGSYWDWQTTGIVGSDYNSFENRPSDVTVDEISFQLHFNVNSTPNSPNANATLKLDQTIGNWDVNMTGGRSNLENYSLAISYFVALQSTASYNFVDSSGNPVSNNDIVISDSFEFGSNGADFASAILKGIYTWDKNNTLPYNSSSYTMPLGQFQAVFQSDDGQSTVGVSINEQMYFLAIGFPQWDGFKVYQDPTYSAVVAVSGSTSVGTNNPPVITEVPAQSDITADAGQLIALSWVATDDNPDYYEVKDENGNVIATGSWSSGVPVEVVISVQEGTHSYTITFYDTDGNSVTSDPVTITGNPVNTTTSPGSSTTSPGATTTSPGTTSEQPTSISKVSRTSKSISTSSAAPGFTIEILLLGLMTITPILLRRKRKE